MSKEKAKEHLVNALRKHGISAISTASKRLEEATRTRKPAATADVPLALPRCEGAAPSWNSKSSRNMCSRCSSSPIISGCTQLSKITFAPSMPICGE